MIDRLLRFAVVIVAIAFLPLTAEAGTHHRRSPSRSRARARP